MKSASASRLQTHQKCFDNVKVWMHLQAPRILIDVTGTLESHSPPIAITNTRVIENILVNNIRRFLELDLHIGQTVAFIMNDLSIGQNWKVNETIDYRNPSRPTIKRG